MVDALTRGASNQTMHRYGWNAIIAERVSVKLIRRDKLNSQFIVTRFSILHAGGRSLFRFHISPTATFSMIARDIKLTRLFTSLRGPGEVIKELLGSTVTTEHGIMQRLLPVTWTDTIVRPYGRTAPGRRQNESRCMIDGGLITAQQKDERRQDNGDKKRLALQHLSDILRSLIRERDTRRTALRCLDSASSFTISNLPCAPREAHDAHAYTSWYNQLWISV